MKLHVAICDDENIICNEVKMALKKLKPDYEIDIFHSGCELLNSNVTYDLIFLDIEMPDINGMKTAESLRNGENEEHIIFLTSHTEFQGNTKLVRLKEILCFEAFGDGTYIYTKKEVLESKKSLKYWMNEIGNEHFYQVHKSYFASFRYIKKIDTTEIQLHHLKQSIPVSRRKLPQFKKAFFEYIKKNAKYI